jgi:hypothetical protein
MTTTDLTGFRDLFAAKRAELSGSRGLEKIAVERSADPLEEVSTSQRENLRSPVSIANPRSAATSNWP